MIPVLVFLLVAAAGLLGRSVATDNWLVTAAAATTPAQREHARTFGPSVSTASANGVDYRPLLGRVGADGPDLEAADA